MCFVVGPWKPLGWFLTRFEPCCCCNKPKAEAASCLFVCHKARQKSLALDTKRSSLSFQLQLHFWSKRTKRGTQNIFAGGGSSCILTNFHSSFIIVFQFSNCFADFFLSLSHFHDFLEFYDFCNFFQRWNFCVFWVDSDFHDFWHFINFAKKICLI